VNPDPLESNLRRVTPELLAERLEGLDPQFLQASGLEELRADMAGPRELWRSVIYAALLLALVELAVARKIDRPG
jgi:hypothetical protein